VPALLAYIGYWSKTAKHLLVLSFTGFGRVEIPQCSGLLPMFCADRPRCTLHQPKRLPRPSMAGAFSVHGFNEQIFGANEQILVRGPAASKK